MSSLPWWFRLLASQPSDYLSQKEHNRSYNRAIRGKDIQRMRTQIIDQPFDGKPAHNRSRDKSHGKQGQEFTKIRHLDYIEHFVSTCCKHHRHGHEKRKPRRGWPVEAAEHTATDGCSTAGRTGEDRDDLHNA